MSLRTAIVSTYPPRACGIGRFAPSLRRTLMSAFEWHLGRSHLKRPLYDFATGGCSDGLGSGELNQNEGAESTFALYRVPLLLDAAGIRASVEAGALEPAAA